MTRQRVTILIVLLLVAAVSTWIALNTYWTEVTISGPMQGEAATNPTYAAQHFTELLGARAVRHEVVGPLPSERAVILLRAWHWDLIPQRREQLKRWVERGGRLVLDTTLIGGEKDLQRWLGVEHCCAESSSDKDEPVVLTVVGSGRSSMQHESYTICPDRFHGALTTNRKVEWGLKHGVGYQALRARVGRGSVTVFNSVPFTNHNLLECDNTLVFVVATQLQKGDEVHFMSGGQAMSFFALLWHYGGPVIVLLLLLIAFTLWRAVVRFGPFANVQGTARRSLAEQIRGTGVFTLQFGGGQALHAAAARAVNEAAERRVPHFSALPQHERVSAIAQAARVDAAELAAALNFKGPRKAGEMRTVLALLESARRTILQLKQR